MNDDRQLLARYAENRSESAFAELVTRHIDMVYSAALRVVHGDAHLAEDVTQIVFTDLARKAATLPREVLLAGWLYRSASFTAIKAVRSEHRRRQREQTAMQIIPQNDQPEGDWEQIAPDLDKALNALSEADRNAIVLRFLKRYDFRTVASALGVSDDAAQKRVSRALEKLRDILRPTRAGAKWTVTSLASVLAADAVTAAPAGLATSVVVTSLGAATAVSTGIGTGLTALKLMGMSKLQIAAAAAVVLGVVTTPIAVQQRSLNRIREENVALRQKAADLVAQHETVLASAQAQPAVAAETQFTDANHVELLRLRNEVRQLREQVKSGVSAPASRALDGGAQAADPDAIAQLGLAASRGDFTALDKIAELVTAAMKARTNEHEYVLRHIDPAFTILATEAGKGNDTALRALWGATRDKRIAGLATDALGAAAGMGNEKALEPLLDPERYGLLLSSTVSALKPAAEAGNQRAIDALASVATESKHSALWFLTAQGLEKPALSGNTRAIDALSLIARSDTSENGIARKEALNTLESAAFKQQPAAAEALRGLGYQ